MLETIKSYLVSLGFNVDRSSHDQAVRAMDTVENSVAKFGGSSVKHFAMAGAAVTAFVTASVLGIAKFIGELAQADLAAEKMARQMWTSKENAMAFNNSLKAMKATLDDLYLSPELMNNFKELRALAFKLQAPKEYQQQMKFIRSIQFEFTKMKLEATYSLQWIGYYLLKYMDGPLTKIKAGLMNINDVIIKEMPEWTKEVARVLSWFLRAGETIVRFGGDVLNTFEKLGDRVPNDLKAIGAALIALGVIIKTGPLGILIFALTGLILLLDDFYTYLDGGDAQFGELWEKLPKDIEKISSGVSSALKDLKEFWDSLKSSDAADKLKHSAETVVDTIKTIFGGVRKEVTDIYDELERRGEFKEFRQNLKDIGNALADLQDAWTSMINETLKLEGTQELMKGLGKVIKFTVVEAVDALNKALGATARILEGISALIKGDLGGVKKSITGLLDPVEKNLGPKGPGPLQSFADSMVNGMKSFNNFFGKMFNNPWTETPGYTVPTTSNQTNNNQKIDFNQTNNIYGSDPQATADAASENAYDMWIRNTRGVIV